LEKLRIFVRKWLSENVPVARDIPFEDWLASTSYNEERKNEIRKANDENRGGRPSHKVCQRVESHVKTEAYPEWKHVRIINSRCDRFKAFSGRYFKAIEEALYSNHFFIKHVPVPERPGLIKRLQKAGRHYYGTDFTAFESHMTPAVMDVCECELYLHCLPWTQDAQFLCDVISGWNDMRHRCGVRAVCQGRRMSGDMCTSVGNGFTNLMLALFFADEQKCTLDGFLEGDDGLFATDATFSIKDYADMGFTIKMEEYQTPNEASFCGMVFADSGEIIREPVRFLSTFGWTSSFIGAGDRIMQELLRAKSLSAIYETPQCPIIGAVARYGLEATTGFAPRFVDDGYHVVPRDTIDLPVFKPSHDTRELFARVFGVSVPVQLLIEDHVSKGDFNIIHLLPPEAVRPHEEYASRFVERG